MEGRHNGATSSSSGDVVSALGEAPLGTDSVDHFQIIGLSLSLKSAGATMRLALIISTLLMLVMPGMARAQSVDARWGILAELVERDLEGRLLATIRWEEPNEVLVWTDWSPVNRSEWRYTLDHATGHIKVSPGHTTPLKADHTGELLWVHGNKTSPFLTRTPDGGYRARWNAHLKWDYRLIEKGSGASTKLAKLIAAGKVRAGDPTLSMRLASSPALPQSPQSTPAQTIVSTAVEQSSPAPYAPAIAAAAASTGPRLALIIGNSEYGSSGLSRLPNPVNDADAMAQVLTQLGFDVQVVKNADQKSMKRAIANFGERLRAAGSSATSLFFYAGHGIQSRGINYLVPVGAKIRAEADVDIESVAAEGVLAQMEEAGTRTNIVILDACRNMPLSRAFRSAGRGLAPMDAPNGTFIAYSTAPGSVAEDGLGANSPFVTALLQNIGRRGEPIEAIFRDVRRTVLTTTEGHQRPWDASSLIAPFYFAGN